ncbi:AIR synthase-related protein, partial [Brevundimonas sp.]|uniref:AIR synthase-related protein n=1 Tax=Brevundimonas sp. TaxID=1871086 RepID=UPI002FC9FBB9
HDLSDGGLVGAAADIALASDVGIELNASSAAHAHAFLFGEDQARYLVAVPNADEILAKAKAAGLTAAVVGKVGGADFAGKAATGELFRIPVAHVREMHESWMPNWIEG